jgi:DNA polymerase III epsilon subunit-like protein
MKYDNRFLAVDTETGGLPSALKKMATIEVALTEIAVVAIDNEKLEMVSKDSWLIKPYDPNLIYDKFAEQASGISKEMCEKDGIELETVYKNFKEILQKNKKGKNLPIIIFHNKPFDTEFIENMFKLFDDDFYKYIDRIEDTMEFARLKWVEKPNFKLASVVQYCGLDHVQAHRALPDTIITAECWIHFMKCLRGEGQEQKKENKFRYKFKF